MNDDASPAQPWLTDTGERIRGQQLDGDLAAILSLEDETMPARRAIAALQWHLSRATTVGHPAPIVEDMSRRMRHPVPGDVVIESTSGRYQIHAQRGDWWRAVGVLLLTRLEWDSNDEDWHAEVDAERGLADQRTSTEYTYVQYGPDPADVCRWENCTFAMVPWSMDMLREVED